MTRKRLAQLEQQHLERARAHGQDWANRSGKPIALFQQKAEIGWYAYALPQAWHEAHQNSVTRLVETLLPEVLS